MPIMKVLGMGKFNPIIGAAPSALRRKILPASEFPRSSPAAEIESSTEDSAELPFVADDVVNDVFEEWQQRAAYFPTDLLSEPAWGILLELLLAETQGRRCSLARVRKVSAVPPTTADRWVKALEREGFINRHVDARQDGDEVVGLSLKGSAILRRYFVDVVHSSERFKPED